MLNIITDQKMQIKTCYHFTPTQITIIKKSDNNRCWQGCGIIGTLVHCWQEIENIITATLESSLAIYQRFKHTSYPMIQQCYT